MKREGESLEVIPSSDGLPLQGLSSPPMKKLCVDNIIHTTEGVENTEVGAAAQAEVTPLRDSTTKLLSSSGLASPPMKSTLAYATGGAESAEGGASPQPAAEAEEKVAENTSLLGPNRQFPCVWLNGAGGLEPSPTKPTYEVAPHIITPASPKKNELNSNRRTTALLPPEGAAHKILESNPKTSEDVSAVPALADGESIEVCPECQKVFKRKVYLQRHMEREHWSTAKVFKCDDCSYETKHQSNLAVHRRIHTGERPYHCGACGQRYTQGHLLKSHIRSRHGGNMEFYNLEKKSDSTRGRKSLDMKHDPTSATLLGNMTTSGGKSSTEKISNLVQQMEQQKMMHRNAMNSLFNSNMSPFGNSLTRPMMPPGSPLVGGISTLLGGPPMFSLNNIPKAPAMPGSLFPGLQQGLATSLLQQHTATTTGVTTTPTSISLASDGQPYEGIKLPLKLESPEKQEQVRRSSPHQFTDTRQLYSTSSPQPIIATQEGQQSPPPHKTDLEEPMVECKEDELPQDLTLTKQSPPPPPLIHRSALTRRESTDSQNEIYTYSSVIRAEECSPMVDSPMSASLADDSDAAPTPPPAINWEKTTSEMSRKITEKLLKASGNCENGDCAHAQKLLDLRKNIVRILNVLTPDMSIEDGMDYRTDQVDQLLYDVIYCSMDEIENGSKHCRESSIKT